MFCEVCGRRLDTFERAHVITRQFHGEFKKLLVCPDCNEQHKKELELTRQNFQMQFGDEPKKEETPSEETELSLYEVTFHLVSGQQITFVDATHHKSGCEYILEVISKPFTVHYADGHAVVVNMKNVASFNVHKKEKEE